MKEEWRPVIGVEQWYEVSNTGRVRRSAAGQSTNAGRVLRPSKRKTGRLTVYLSFDNRRLQGEVHRLVAAAFIGPCPIGKEVNHLDGNPANNNVGNLEYCTRRENMQHAYRLGLVSLGIGEDQHLAKLTTDQVIVIRNCTAPSAVLARVFGVSKGTIQHVRSRRTWKHI